MSQVIMLFLFPLGVYFYFFVERKDRSKYEAVFTDFQKKVRNDTALDQEEKKTLFQSMLKQNGYTLTSTSKTQICGEKRILSMSLLAMSLGVYLVGVFVYLGYYFWIQKPHKICYSLEYEV